MPLYHEEGPWEGQLIVKSLEAYRWGSHMIAFTNAQSLDEEKWGVILGAAIRFGVHILAVCETWKIDRSSFNPQILGYRRHASRVLAPGWGMMFWVRKDVCTNSKIAKDNRHVTVLKCQLGRGM